MGNPVKTSSSFAGDELLGDQASETVDHAAFHAAAEGEAVGLKGGQAGGGLDHEAEFVN